MFRSIDRFARLGLMALFAGACSLASAQMQLPPGHHCAESEKGEIFCSRFPGGDGLEDKATKDIVCGKGHCQIDYFRKGALMCAKAVDGVAAYNRKGEVVCSGGCEPASKDMCEKLTP